MLYEVGRLIGSSLDPGEVLERVMDSLIRVTGAERGFVMLIEPTSGELRVEVARNLDRATIDSAPFEVSRHLVDEVVANGTPLLVRDAINDPAYQDFQSVVSLRLRSILCAPLQVRGKIIGAMYVDNRLRVGLFGQADLDLLVAFASQAAIAIDNARLYRGLEQRLAEIAALQAYQANIFQSVASGVVVVDATDHVATLNAAAAAIFGVPAEQALGRPYAEVLGPDMSQFLRAYRAGALPLDTHTGASHDVACEVPGRGRVYLSARVTRLGGADGHEGGLVLALEDQTRRRQLEKEKQAEEEKRLLLGRFFSEAVREEILRNPEAAEKLAGVRKEISVLFADIRGYTSLSEDTPPETLVALLNRYLELATQAIRVCEGTVDKYIGDALMALFNAPTDQADHAERAVWAAIALQGSVVRVNLPDGRKASFGVGVNTGEAVAGYIGTPDLMSYTAIGDAVNVAARLQASAGPGEIVISEATYQRVRDVFAVERLGPLEVRGRREPVVAYRVLGPKV